MGLIDIYRRNFRLGSFLKFFLVVFMLALLIGCTQRETVTSYIKIRDRLQSDAVNACEVHGQQYLLHYTNDLVNWEVVCYQRSPVKHFTYMLN